MSEKGSIRISVAGATDVGLVREHNEDNLLVVDLTAGERLGSGDSLSRDLGERGLLVSVADGMGGAASGELASEMAVDTVHEKATALDIAVGKTDVDAVAAGLSDCLTAANTRIFDKSQAETEHRGMGTTMTAVWALGNYIAIAQVGDSRAYLMRKGKLVQVTKDQSLISQLIEDGTLTEEEAERLGGRNIILQALGVEEGVSVETKTMEVLAGDLLLLCSDGLSGMVKDAQIEEAVAGAEDPGPVCARLVGLANEGGGRDNITVILVRFDGEGLRAPMQPLEAEEGAAAPAFAPPEIPKAKPAKTKPLLFGFGALLVAVIAFFVLTGGSGDITLAFPVAGVSGTLTPTDGDGAPRSLEPAAGSKEVLLADLPAGRYRIEARHEDYEDFSKVYEISGQGIFRVEMIPLPGRLGIASALGRVQVAIEWTKRNDDSAPWTKEFPLETTDPVTLEEVPAGKLTFTVTRDQFRTATIEKELPPNGNLEFTIPELDPRLGRLEVTSTVPGMQIVIRDDWGEEVWSGSLPESGTIQADVRIGEHTLKATHEKYETFEDVVAITADGMPTIRIKAIGKRGTLQVTGPEGARVFVKATGARSWEKREKIPAAGQVLFPRVPPGEYEVRIDQAGRPSVRQAVTVEAAKQTTVEFPR